MIRWPAFCQHRIFFNCAHTLFSCFLFLVLNGLSAAVVDLEQAQRGQRLRLSDGELSRDRDRLFQQEIFLPVPLLIYRIVEGSPQLGPTILASRLLSPTPPEAALVNRQQDERIKLAILREFRFRPDHSLLAVYAQVLAQEQSVAVVQMVLLDGLRLDLEGFADHALRLAVASARNAHPAAEHTRMRRFALQSLVAQAGLQHPATLSAMRHAITQDNLLVCLAALEELPDGVQPGLSAVALSRVLPAITRGERGLPWSIALAALRRCRLTAEHPLSSQLASLALSEGRSRDVFFAVMAAVRSGRVSLPVALRRDVQALAVAELSLTQRMVIADLLGPDAGPLAPQALATFAQARQRVTLFLKPPVHAEP